MQMYLNPDFAFAAISMILTIYSASLVGRVFLSNPYIGQVVVGLTIFSIVLSPLTYLNASLFRPLGISIVLVPPTIRFLSFFRKTSNKKYKSSEIQSLRVRRKIDIKIFLFAALSIYFIQDLFPHKYVFETHDSLYLGWLDGFWNTANSGALIVSSASPQHLGSFHVQPSVLVAVLGIFSPTMNLLLAQFMKSVFLTIFFSSFLVILVKKCNYSALSALLFLMTLFFVAGRYVGYSLGMSSYLYVIFLLLICMNVFWRLGNSVDLWVLFSLLIVAKAPIFLVVVIPSLFLFLKLIKVIPAHKKICVVLLTMFGVSTWLLGGRSLASSEGIPSFFGAFPNISSSSISQNYQTWLSSFSTLNSWMLDYVGTSLLPKFIEPVNLTRANIIWIVLSVYILYYLIFKTANLSSQVESNSKVALHLFMFSSLLSLLIIRNGIGATIAHQIHSYYLAVVVTAFVLALVVSKVKRTFISVGLAVSLLFLNFRFNNLPILKSTFIEKSKSESSVIIFNQNNVYDFLGAQMKEEVDANARKQVLASLLGEKLLWADTKDITNSQLNRFLEVPK